MRDTVRVGVSLIRQAQRGVFAFSMKAVNYRYSSKQSLSPAVFLPSPTPSATCSVTWQALHQAQGLALHITSPDWCRSPSQPAIISHNPVDTITVVGSY